MIFVKTDELKEGMRLGRPIYNKKGVLLYERDSKLSKQALDSVKNFGLLGIYVLEPAEPCPPMSKEDIEFERFQTMGVFSIEEILRNMLNKGKATGLYEFADSIVSRYGRLDHRINFQQSLRSNDDYVFKHTLNTAVLCAMLSYKLQFHIEEQIDCIMAAIVHEVGKLNIPDDLKKQMTSANRLEIERKYEQSGLTLIGEKLYSKPQIKRMATQAFNLREELEQHMDISHMKLTKGSRVLAACDQFDSLTAMSLTKEPETILGALKIIRKNEDIYGNDVIQAFIRSIYFLPEGSNVVLTNKEKGLVIAANDYDIFKPVVLTYSNNKLIDLRRYGKGGLEILDIVKKFDTRYVIDRSVIDSAKEALELQSDMDKQ